MGNFYTITVSTLGELWSKFLLVVPNVVLAVIVFIIGLLIAAFAAKLIRRVFKILLIDKLLGKIGLGRATDKAGLKLNSGKFIGEIVRWFIVLVFLIAVADMLNLVGLSEFLNNIVLYTPNIFAAVLIVFVATVFAYFVERLIMRSLKAAKYEHYGFVAGIAKWAIFIFAILAALVQLRVAPEMIQVFFTGIVAMITIAGGLAFGLGGQDFAKDVLDKIKKDFKRK